MCLFQIFACQRPQKSFHSTKQTNSVATLTAVVVNMKNAFLRKNTKKFFVGVWFWQNWIDSIYPVVSSYQPCLHLLFSRCALCSVLCMRWLHLASWWHDPLLVRFNCILHLFLFQHGLDHHMKGLLTAELLNGRLAPKNQGPNHPKMV